MGLTMGVKLSVRGEMVNEVTEVIQLGVLVMGISCKCACS